LSWLGSGRRGEATKVVTTFTRAKMGGCRRLLGPWGPVVGARMGLRDPRRSPDAKCRYERLLCPRISPHPPLGEPRRLGGNNDAYGPILGIDSLSGSPSSSIIWRRSLCRRLRKRAGDDGGVPALVIPPRRGGWGWSGPQLGANRRLRRRAPFNRSRSS
jgi:hypothetical protein